MQRLMLAIVMIFSFISVGYASNNICELIAEHPQWYVAARATQNKWHVPVNVQFAIMHMESNFKPEAKARTTTAYGFAQAVNATWKGYQQKTGNTDSRRDHFKDASDFIGWYAKQMNDRIDIPTNNAYDLYIAYHDGSGGYKKAVRNSQSFAARLARRVQSDASLYKTQLAQCRPVTDKAMHDQSIFMQALAGVHWELTPFLGLEM